MVDAVLLEWEGVLADTAGARRDALLRALADEGLHLEPADYDAVCEGNAVQAAACAALAHFGRRDDTLADLVALRATRAFAQRLGKGFVLAPGARAFVEHLQLASRVAIVTSATRADTEFLLRLAGLDGAASIIISADDRLDAPPAPARYEKALRHLSRHRALRQDHVVAIASTTAALRAARAAGIRTLAVGTPAHVAVDADGMVDAIDGLTLRDIAPLIGITSEERQP